MTNKETEDDKIVKINKWDGAAVKNALDDAIRDVFTNKFNYAESFTLMDCRLGMCAIAVGVAVYAIVWDYLYPFPQSKSVLIFCVATYFVMMGFLTLYTTYKEKGIFAIVISKSTNKKEKVWELSSYLKRYDDQYNLVVKVTDKNTGTEKSTSFVKSVAKFFDTEGSVVQELVDNEITKLHNSLLSEKKDK